MRGHRSEFREPPAVPPTLARHSPSFVDTSPFLGSPSSGSQQGQVSPAAQTCPIRNPPRRRRTPGCSLDLRRSTALPAFVSTFGGAETPPSRRSHQHFWQPQRDSNPCLHLERVETGASIVPRWALLEQEYALRPGPLSSSFQGGADGPHRIVTAYSGRFSTSYVSFVCLRLPGRRKGMASALKVAHLQVRRLSKPSARWTTESEVFGGVRGPACRSAGSVEDTSGLPKPAPLGRAVIGGSRRSPAPPTGDQRRHQFAPTKAWRRSAVRRLQHEGRPGDETSSREMGPTRPLLPPPPLADGSRRARCHH